MIRGEGRGGGVGKNNIMEKEEGGKWNTGKFASKGTREIRGANETRRQVEESRQKRKGKKMRKEQERRGEERLKHFTLLASIYGAIKRAIS